MGLIEKELKGGKTLTQNISASQGFELKTTS